MSLEWPNLLMGGVVGFVAGFLANAAYERYYARHATAELRRKYERIAGDYVAYPFLAPPVNPASDMIDFNRMIGTCKLIYQRENILLLQYTESEHPNAREALVWMETPFVGSMAWRYVRLNGRQPPAEHRFGFKRCVVSQALTRDGSIRQYLYLIGEPPFGREALEKVETHQVRSGT